MPIAHAAFQEHMPQGTSHKPEPQHPPVNETDNRPAIKNSHEESKYKVTLSFSLYRRRKATIQYREPTN